MDQLYCKYISFILVEVTKDCKSWTSFHPQYQIFQAIIVHAKVSAYESIDLIHPIFQETTKSSGDPEVRLKQFILLAEFLQNWNAPIKEKGIKNFTLLSLKKKIIFQDLYNNAGDAHAFVIAHNIDEPYLSNINFDFNVPNKKFTKSKCFSGGEKTMAAIAFLLSTQK